MIRVLFICHGSILKSPGKASKINAFMKQKGAYYAAIFLKRSIAACCMWVNMCLE